MSREGGEIHEQFSVLRKEERGVAVVAAYGELDLGSASRLREALEEAAPDGEPRVVADLSELSFMDSSGLGLLIEQRGVLQGRGGQLCLVAPESGVAARLLGMTEMDEAFLVHPDRASAVEEALRNGRKGS